MEQFGSKVEGFREQGSIIDGDPTKGTLEKPLKNIDGLMESADQLGTLLDSETLDRLTPEAQKQIAKAVERFELKTKGTVAGFQEALAAAGIGSAIAAIAALSLPDLHAAGYVSQESFNSAVLFYERNLSQVLDPVWNTVATVAQNLGLKISTHADIDLLIQRNQYETTNDALRSLTFKSLSSTRDSIYALSAAAAGISTASAFALSTLIPNKVKNMLKKRKVESLASDLY
ncbi:MAG: hypothetical protein RI935_258 [Candidatus Parcubacteria bacterium]|jgi:hypothetical protein